MNFVDTTVYNGKRFETKQNLFVYPILNQKYVSIFGFPWPVLKILPFLSEFFEREIIPPLENTMNSSELLNNVIYRCFDDLELNKNIQYSLVVYDRNRTPAVKNTRKNSLEFVT